MPTVSPKRAKNEDPYENRAVFVDEFTCIGCKQCIWQAPATFRIEPEHGRSRVYAQCRVQLVAKDVLLHPINGRVACQMWGTKEHGACSHIHQLCSSISMLDACSTPGRQTYRSCPTALGTAYATAVCMQLECRASVDT
eukprot:scaffold139300_cov21-Tisochrysis_lutea.AAC.1